MPAQRAFVSSSAPLAGLCALLLAAVALPAAAQPNQEWFVPGQGGGQQRPAQGQQQQQRPPQQQGQRPPQAGAARREVPPLPPGQPPPAAVIGVVDVPEIQRESAAFNQVREELERRRQRLNEDLQREQNSWREQQQQLANQRAGIPPEQLRQRERDLQDRITESQRIFRERSRAIEQVAQGALVEIEQALGTVIRQVAASRSVNMVLPRPLVIFNEPPFDLTGEVSQQFNRALRSVSIPPESAAGDASAPPAAGAAPAPRPSGGGSQQGGAGQRQAVPPGQPAQRP
jgi:Skp family chaperone for outer membrane proteins